MTLALKNSATNDVSNHILILKTQEGDLPLVIKEIVRIEGERNYSYIYLRDGAKKLVAKTLLAMEELLDSKGFYRCHRSHIVNVDHITSYFGGYTVMISDNCKIPISRRKKKPFQDWYAERD